MARDWFSWMKTDKLRAAADLTLNGGELSQDDAVHAIEMLRDESAEHITQQVGEEFYAQYYPTDRLGGRWKKGFPVGLVDHYTSGINPRGTLKWFSSRPRGSGVGTSSAHVVLDREGILYVVVDPLKRVAWHAPGANSTSIGIEHVNAGLLLRKTDGKFYYLKTRPYPENRVAQLQEINKEKFWEPYSAAQFVSNVVFKRWFIQAVLTTKEDHFVDHQEVDPERKKDCGPLWPLYELNELAFSMKAFHKMEWLKKEILTEQDITAFKKEVSALLKPS